MKENSILCEELINDSIVKINENKTSLTSYTVPSIFESNQYLSDRPVKFIEYTVFCGSLQIFKYLLINKVDLDLSIWIYAIHSDNA